jgi:hypothetical protein
MRKRDSYKGYVFVPPKGINLQSCDAYEIFDWLNGNDEHENVLELDESLIHELSVIWEEIHIDDEFILEISESFWIDDEKTLQRIRSNIKKVKNLTSSQEVIKNEVVRLFDLAINTKQPIFFQF